ncbi:MAG: hypothetical protein ACK5PS_00980 [Desulfopila sp.]
MKRTVWVLSVAAALWVSPILAADSHHHAAPATPAAAAEHSGMEHGGTDGMAGTFVSSAMVDGIHAEFQIMSLASMHMQDAEGATHHVMATFTRGGEKIERVVGRVKLIAPSGKEQIADLKDYGRGNFAANFTIDEAGKWGVICLFKDDQGTHTVKFWYEQQPM